ncbi:two pore domain potassium channel family protein [Phormidium sp. LEGE 05292]|uniref:potassium channel family protein n=1 Tax=[Phormidium] sp. LEGE 05292 TaxID=767427 RepID=UPI0018829323|nr:potassium channel family protein [Phormidium sp. LEGE 05292]MBE9224947.1 two pore domain potassium channel family protein [Phormidium sp. LEGE 05292]
MQYSQLKILTKNKYNRLLFVQLLGLFMFPLVQNNQIVNIVFTLVFFFSFLGTIILIITELEHSKKFFCWYLILALIALICYFIGSLNLFLQDKILVIFTISNVIVLFFMAISINLIVREIFPTRKVTGDTIKGGVCVYLLLGLLWDNIYQIIYSFNSNSFNGIASSHSQADLLYFSYITLTTVGYGDITPVTSIARVLANLEAIVGIMYPAIYISRLVGIYSNEQGKSSGEEKLKEKEKNK